jgi:lipopolysaccharide/colanic/teichoic acid biosynthesis glycosyltransferase
MYKRFIKRFLDIVISIIALPFFFILLVILIPIIYFSDKGSVFYNAPRLGKNGKVFKMYKFRTMKMNAPDIRNEDGSTFNAENDPRLTRIGKLLRKTSVDEIPQLLNVFIGNMSLIGPRPDLPEHEKLYEPREKRKLEVRPGITGLNQAYYRNAIPWKERIAHDIEYIDKLTFNLDFKIFLKTILVIIKRDNVFVDEGDSNVS